jgi:hypothetical protein
MFTLYRGFISYGNQAVTYKTTREEERGENKEGGGRGAWVKGERKYEQKMIYIGRH